jgi:hypothetical protein
MKNSTKIIAGIIISCCVLCICSLWSCKHPAAPAAVNRIVLPQDVLPSCTLAQDTFNRWFANDTPKVNGLVLPANSLAFQHQNNCEFYQWSENMFLWITSPNTGGKYGSGGTVLESPVFYDVQPSPPGDTSGSRRLVPHTANGVISMTSHVTKNGPNRLPVVVDTKGRLLEVEVAKPTANAKAMVKNATGAAVEVGNIAINSKGVLLLTDKAGKAIEHPQAIIRHKLNSKLIVQEFTAGGKSVFLDINGNQVQTEAGQATGNVLMTRNHSLVYYLTMVNDVYAYFVSGFQSTATEFPTTKPALDSILAYAKANKLPPPPDSNALAMELKTSWVEASTLPNPQDYVTIMATIPTYDTTSNTKWVPITNGQKTVKMALVGMHVVGSVAGHPEMVWATFEHNGNTPNAAYKYITTGKVVKTVAQDTGKAWLFSSNASDTAVNHSHMSNVILPSFTSTYDTIHAVKDHIISPSNTLAISPWGSASGTVPNPEDTSSSASNSEIISFNNNIRQLFPGGDVRLNYLLIGASWTSGGVAPNGTVYSATNTAPGATIGTSCMANTTMETNFQSPTNTCFTCHSNEPNTPSLNPNIISHIFSNITPLLNMHDAMDKKKKKK